MECAGRFVGIDIVPRLLVLLYPQIELLVAVIVGPVSSCVAVVLFVSVIVDLAVVPACVREGLRSIFFWCALK